MLIKNEDGQRVTFSLFKNGARIDNPTIAVGDFKVDIDGGGQTNVTTPPTSDAAGLVTWLPSQAETNGTYITLLGNDSAGAEWEPITIAFDTSIEAVLAAIASDIVGADGDTLETLSDQIDTIDLSGVAAAVWEDAPSRTLTSTAAETAAAVAGSDLVITAAVTYNATLTGFTIPATWERIYLTAKSSKSVPDSASWFQLLATNGGDDDDGLQYLDGAAAEDATLGSLTIDEEAGTIAIYLADNATAVWTRVLSGGYDIKCDTDDGESQQLTEANVTITLTETRTL
jgi:hypothetical protein